MQKKTYCGDCSPEEFQKFEPSFRQLISLANKEILPRFLCGIAVLEKSDHTPVTAADRRAEKVMRVARAGVSASWNLRGRIRN